jgi:hypothetical protein
LHASINIYENSAKGLHKQECDFTII